MPANTATPSVRRISAPAPTDSISGVVIARMDVNIFTQIGFLVLVGLACKNAILIVEFAKAQRESGIDRYEATLAACQLRLRPIVMTSFAFILGVVPLMLSVGAGAEMRRTLGVAVFAGMLGVTLFGIFLTPVFYYVIQGFADLRRRADPDEDEEMEKPAGVRLQAGEELTVTQIAQIRAALEKIGITADIEAPTEPTEDQRAALRMTIRPGGRGG
jgi:predicted RND superfamily exporter protein